MRYRVEVRVGKQQAGLDVESQRPIRCEGEGLLGAKAVGEVLAFAKLDADSNVG